MTRWWRHFRAQVLVLVLLGVFILAAIVAFISASITVKQLELGLDRENRQLLNVFAQQSKLALLFDSPDNAVQALKLVQQFAGIEQAAILHNDGVLLAGKASITLDPALLNSLKEPYLLSENDYFWAYLAPVFSTDDQSADDAQAMSLLNTTPQKIGIVYLQRSKSTLHDSRQRVLYATAATAFGAALLIALALHIVLRRVVRPVVELSATMAQGQLQGKYIQARVAGAEEIRQMAQQFNQLMQTLAQSKNELRAHRDQLESEVQLRTHELVQARDAALAANKAQSEFLANMSHELRTPLQAIIGYGDVLHEELLMSADVQLVEDVERIVSNANHLLEIINNILDMAKIEAGRMTINRGSCDIGALIRDVCGMVKPLVDRSVNTLAIDIASEVREPLLTDPQKLRQVLLNLLSNAAKFTHNGRIEVKAYRRNEHCVIEVRDSGVGIPLDKQEQIFEKFRQVDGSETRRYGGTGLGLSITRHLCELLDGTIELQSEPGKGAVFSVILPWQNAERGVVK